MDQNEINVLKNFGLDNLKIIKILSIKFFYWFDNNNNLLQLFI